MMNIYTVSFFGHREINNIIETESKLGKIIRNLLRQKEYAEFLVGRDGKFDLLVSSTIKRVTENCCYGNSDHVLVLPYMKAEYKNNKQNYNDYYDEIEVCSESSSAHYKSAIYIRNMNMVDRSNMIVCYIRHNSGGAYKAVQYAKKKSVEICNIADFNFTVR